MSDSITQTLSGLLASLPTTLASASGQANGLEGSGLNNGATATFALLMAKALLEVALELEQPSTGSGLGSSLVAGSQTPTVASLDSLVSSLSSNPTSTTGQTYAAGVATRAYQSSSGWNFIPTYIAPGTADTSLSNLVQPASVTAPVTASQLLASNSTTSVNTVTATNTAAVTQSTSTAGAMALSDFPRPADDNGRGMHWIPTVSSTPEVVDRYVNEMKQMKVKWAVILNDGTDATQNDYLVKQLVANGIEPVMRVQTPGLQPIAGDLAGMVRHYTSLGVHYFQLYNEPNHPIENDGKTPDVSRYVDLWLPAAKVVAENGGLPGLGALSPGGDDAGSPGRVDDREFLKQALQQIKDRGETGVLDHAWLSAHNYMGDKPLADTDGLLRVQQYDKIINDSLGRSMPIVGTEGGSYVIGSESEPVATSLVTSAMKYMQTSRSPYNFAYSYWVVANSLGGGHDSAFEWQALFQPGHTSPIVDALKSL